MVASATKAPADLRRLAEPFPARDIEWRVQSCGERNGKVWAKVLAYVTNRAIMDRLDAVCGPAGWRNEFREWTVGGQAGVLCGISVLIDGEWVTKWDGAENTDVEPVKGGLSSAMKRCGVQWGIGRYLYDLEEGWAEVRDKGQHYAKTKEGKAFYWNPPALPSWAMPSHGSSDGRSTPRAAHDALNGVEANSLSPQQQLAARQANPQPRKVYCTQQQQDAIRDIADEIGLDNDARVQILKDAGVKRVNMLTPETAGQVVLGLCRRRVEALLTELGLNLDDVRVEAPSVTADLPDELDQDQANTALAVLRKAKERAEVAV